MAGPLATRCPSCSTVFRVVPDQLRVSGGWVRCGRCTEVFDATLSLVDMESGAPRAWADRLPRRASAPAAGEPAQAAARAITAAVAADDAARPPGEPVAARDLPPAADPWAMGPGLAPLTAPTEPAPPDAPPAPPADGAAPAAADSTPEPAAIPVATPAAEPAFVRRAERAQRWRSPRLRGALAAAALLGALALAAQIAYTYRDLVAARYPQARPALEAACGWLDCRVEAARAIDSLTVESSGLLRVERSDVYRLSVALRNAAGIEVALPALDLALTDARGRPVARRVLQPAELGAASATIGPGRETTLQASLQAALPDAEPVAGYTIELFYP